MDHDDYHQPAKKSGKLHNTLPLWGNESTMNLNPLILANIQSSSYFKVHLFKLKTYHEVVDEIYYQVKHLEPWERGSRKTAGQTGMCGGVRGVGAGGIVSTAYCLLYKLYTLRLTRKQVNGLLAHTDSPYIRALGFMYIRYTQPPSDLYDWYEDYLQDDEEIDVKAGGGQVIIIGQMLHQWLVKLDWFSTLFPRIPVPIQKQIENKLAAYSRLHNVNLSNRFTATATSSLSASGASGSNDRESSAYGNNSAVQRDNRDWNVERERDRDREYRGGRERNVDRDRGGGGGGGGSGFGQSNDYRNDGRRYQSRSRSRERNNNREYHRENRDRDRGNPNDYRDGKEYHRPTPRDGRDYKSSSNSSGRHRDYDRKYR